MTFDHRLSLVLSHPDEGDGQASAMMAHHVAEGMPVAPVVGVPWELGETLRSLAATIESDL